MNDMKEKFPREHQMIWNRQFTYEAVRSDSWFAAKHLQGICYCCVNFCTNFEQYWSFAAYDTFVLAALLGLEQFFKKRKKDGQDKGMLAFLAHQLPSVFTEYWLERAYYSSCVMHWNFTARQNAPHNDAWHHSIYIYSKDFHQSQRYSLWRWQRKQLTLNSEAREEWRPYLHLSSWEHFLSRWLSKTAIQKVCI